ncbi:MAG: nucleotide exchange factor GrpE [Betaproteobacteria bacterium]|nr:nucleotide exchange factor GrpE [Betaproteobacteria bacterium]
MSESEATQRPESAPGDQPAPAAESPQPAQRSCEELLAEANTRADEQRDAWLRALADADNARKRAQADIAAAQKFAIERFVRGLLPVVDSLEAALGTGNGAAESLKSGVELTLKQLRAALEQGQVSAVEPAAGERFDPHRHQAMAAVESDAEPNTVLAVMQKGYLLHDRVLRPALVTVAKPRPANDA